MKIFAISDLHLSNSTNKPMDVFGYGWVNHWQKIRENWVERVTEEDVVLIAGDVSWGMNIQQAIVDLQQIDELPGKKVIIRGNHDYWWSTYKKICQLNLKSIVFIQNNAEKIGNYIFCGTRGWDVPESNETQSEEDKKIFDRELIRLELTLKEAQKLKTNDEEIIGLIHYPPFNSKFEDSQFVELFLKNNVKRVVYGHLHGSQVRVNPEVDKHGTKFYLTSCDFLKNELLEL